MNINLVRKHRSRHFLTFTLCLMFIALFSKGQTSFIFGGSNSSIDTLLKYADDQKLDIVKHIQVKAVFKKDSIVKTAYFLLQNPYQRVISIPDSLSEFLIIQSTMICTFNDKVNFFNTKLVKDFNVRQRNLIVTFKRDYYHYSLI